ncbi:MAG: MFS transporter [Rhodobacteraceae bacterium]|nr:MFS transporter [Paracoccaceae bacterium]
MRLLISFAALFLSITLLQLSSGAIAPLDALSGLQTGFTTSQIGLLGSSHFLGFFVGCWWAPRLMGSVGHARTFSIFAAFGAIGAIAHPMLIDALAWAFFRMLTGLCVAGCYTVIEAWMQAKLTNSNRGRVMGTYRVVDIFASSAAQMMIGLLEPAAYASYNLLAILCCACILPLAMTSTKQPETPKAIRLQPRRAWQISPLGVAGVIVAGLTSSAFRMVGPLYASEVGLTQGQIGTYMALVLIGGAVAQFPTGWLADKFDRRQVLILLSVASIAASLGMAAVSSGTALVIFAAAAIFGFATYPIFSVSTAHANDFCSAEDTVSLNASLLFFYAVGAIFSPLVASMLIQTFGAFALFTFVSVAHAGLLVFGVARMRARPTSEARTNYTYVPRTSFLVGRLLRRKR